MKRPLRSALRATGLALVAAAGLGTAVLVGVALATTFTLHEAKNATIMNANTGAVVHEDIVTNARSFAVYTLSGDSKTNPKCLSRQCRMIWPWVTVPAGAKPTKGSGVSGRLSLWHHKGVFQVLLNGHPLYRFSFDNKPKDATGEAIHSFGGTWHVVKGSSSTSGTGSTMSTSTMTSTMTTTASTPTCTTLYCY